MLETLKLTRSGAELIDLDYIAEEETVVAHFQNGNKVNINVDGVSGITMIRYITWGIGG